METRDAKEFKLNEMVIRICPSCGVVNPSGPSGGCPHLQLVRFDGVPEALEQLLGEVAEARRLYTTRVASLKRDVMDAVRSGMARVETPHTVKAGEVDGLYADAGKAAGQFSLTHPSPPAPKKKKPSSGRRKDVASNSLDDRQLDLLALSTPRGDA